jgi:hypothetical protein
MRTFRMRTFINAALFAGLVLLGVGSLRADDTANASRAADLGVLRYTLFVGQRCSLLKKEEEEKLMEYMVGVVDLMTDIPLKRAKMIAHMLANGHELDKIPCDDPIPVGIIKKLRQTIFKVEHSYQAAE